MEQYADFSGAQAVALIDAATNNDQIYRIFDDDDVYGFFTQIAIDHEGDIDPEQLEDFWDVFER